MATIRSLAEGIGIAAAGMAAGYFGGNFFDYLGHMGRYDHLNEFNQYVSAGLRFAGFVITPLAGAYQTFLSDTANPAPNFPANNQPRAQGPRNVTNVRINVRGGRNRFRL